MSLKNPFIYNAPVPSEQFVNRDPEVDQILSQLANPARVSSAISGDPRVGKTSLLHYLRQEQVREQWGLSPDWCHFLYLDCHTIVPFAEKAFWHQTLRQLERPLSGTEELSRRLQWLLLLEETSPDIYDLNSFFDEIARAERLVVLMLDEFEGVIQHLDRKAPRLLYHLRALLNRPERGLALIVATRSPLDQLCAKFEFAGSQFDNSFAHITLSPFHEAAVDQLLSQYGVDLSTTERTHLRRVAGTHPFLVQLTASLIVRARNNHAGDEGSLSKIDGELERATGQYFLDMLNYSTEWEKMLLAWLALHHWSQQLPSDQPSLGRPVRNFGRHHQEINHLVQRGLVLDQAEGPVIFSPTFARSVLRNVLVADGEEILTLWEPHFDNFLSQEQWQAFTTLTREINQTPGAIDEPELLNRTGGEDESKVFSSLLDRYTIETLIGRSSTTELYQGYDPRLGRAVAIKKLRETLPKDEEARTRFEREAQAIAGLRHPHIVQIYDFEIQNDHPYMVMEFIEGRSLKEYLQEIQEAGQSLAWEEMLRIAGHVADALDYAHRQQMIHRDIRPSNVMLAHSGDIFLTDFSVVRLLGQPSITQTGQLLGSVAYMAPEQVRGESKGIDYRADIYSLGCVVYEMLTGHPPFARAELPWAHLNTYPVAPDRLVSNLPDVASQVIMRALAKDRDERPLSASQFINSLREALTMHHSIRLGGMIVLREPEGAVVKRLYAESNYPLITEVSIQQEFHGGLTEARVILVQPIDDRGRALAHEVVKIAPAAMLRREFNRYRRFVWGRLPATAASLLREPVELNNLAALSYGFVRDQPSGFVRDLEAYYDDHTAEEVAETLTRLMTPLDARWYGESEPLLTSFADEYGRQMPAHLKLRAERILSGGDFTPGVHRLIDVDTVLRAEERLQIGERVALRDLQITQVRPERIKLSSVGDGPVIWVQVNIDTPRPDLQEGDWVNVLGVIEARRHDVLTTAGKNVMEFSSDLRRLPNDNLHVASLDYPCPNPLLIYQTLLRQPLNGRRSIIHGDLHPGNILVDDSSRAWLIDFDHVREGHVLFDFIKLEIIFRLFVLGGVRRQLKEGGSLASLPAQPAGWPHTYTLAEYAAFEVALVQQTVGEPAQRVTHPDLAKAGWVILAIRRLAEPYLRKPNGWREYLIGLFLHNLAQLKFYQEHPHFGILPFTTAAVVAREMDRLDD